MKESKVIDIVCTHFYPVAAGTEVNIMETYSELVKNGWQVTVHTSRDTLTEKDVLDEHETHRGIQIRRYHLGPLGFFPRLHYKRPIIIALHNFNIFPFIYVFLYSLSLKILGRKKYILVLTPHGGFTPEWSVLPRREVLAKRVYHATVGTLLINFTVDKIRAVSEWEKHALVSSGVREKIIKTIPNGVEDVAYQDVNRLASPETKDLASKLGRYFVQVGRIEPVKNLETAIRAMTLIPKDVNYLIIGPEQDRGYKSQLERLTKSLNLQDRVIFGGVIKGANKFYLLRKAQMMVHMALWESFCNTVNEGLSQGLICIVANNTALPYLVKNGINGFCVETRDFTAVGRKINLVLEKQKTTRMKVMAKNNREFALQTSWADVAKKMDTLYSKMLFV